MPAPSAARLRLSAARPWLLAALVAAAVLRTAALYRFGPLTQPDSEDYLAFAKMILSGGDWFSSASMEGITAFRTIGYPAVIAAAKLLAGEHFDILIVLLQSVLSLVAMVQLYRVGRALGLPDWAAACAAAAYGCGVVAIYDLNLLTDSLFASLAVCLVCQLALVICGHRPDRPLCLFLAGTLLAACVLLRDATLFASPFFALGAFTWGYLGGRSWWRALRAATIFLMPALIVTVAYLGWNQYRSGYRFLTTGSQHAMLMGPVMLEQQGVPVLREPVLREAYARTASLAEGPFFVRIVEMSRWLQREAGLDVMTRSKLGAQAYLTAWREAPFGMAKLAAQEYSTDQFLLLVTFTHPWRALSSLAGRDSRFDQRIRNLIADPTPGNLIQLAARLFGLAASAAIFAGFVMAGVVSLWRLGRGHCDSDTVVIGWFFVLYAGFVGMYTVVHLEVRYTIAMQAIALIGGAAVIHRTIWQMRRKIAGSG